MPAELFTGSFTVLVTKDRCFLHCGQVRRGVVLFVWVGRGKMKVYLLTAVGRNTLF